MKTIILSFGLMLFAASVTIQAQWIKQNVNTIASLRGLSVVNEKIVWASGTGGTVIRTINGGEKWDVITVPGAEKLDFRDIEAFDAKTAYILSIGNGDSSRIYKTIDGGKNWTLQFKNANEKAFFDAIACWDRNNCIAMSDPVDKKFVLIETLNSGQSWNPVAPGPRPSNLILDYDYPIAVEGEAAFAASGSCLIVGRKKEVFIGTGGSRSSVLYSSMAGKRWLVRGTEFVAGTAASGIFSIAIWNGNNGVIVGGNYEKPDEARDNLAFTKNGGQTWVLGNGLNGYRSGVTYVNKNLIVAVGTNGSDITYDGGKTWSSLDRENYNSVQSKGLSATWAVGPKGRVAFCPILQLQKTRESRRSN